MQKVVSLTAVIFAAIIAIPLLGAAAIFGRGGATCIADPGGSVAVPTAVAHSGSPIPALDGWDTEQLTNVATIVTVGAGKAVPPWGWVVAVATAIQESDLRNLPGGDRDSIGLFQQRPSQGWGTPAQLTDPAYQAGAFFDKLLTIDGWQRMPVTEAAQAVQRSAYPDAYAKHTTEAIRLVSHVGSSAIRAITTDLEHCVSICPPILSNRPSAAGCDVDGGGASLPPGFNLPVGTPPQVVIAVGWALDQLGTPYSFGGDCTAAHSGDPARECDCSSLVQVAYRAAGIKLPRIAADQSGIGLLVSDPAQLRPGDLLFIPGADGTVAEPGHVGMYLGDGLVVSAPSTGQVVRVSALSTYWLTAVTIRRLVG